MVKRKFSKNVDIVPLNFGGGMKRKRGQVATPTVRGAKDIQRVLDEAKNRKIRGLKL